MHFTIRVKNTYPKLGLHSGDLITVEPELECLLMLHRPLSDIISALYRLLESGGVELLTPDATVSDFTEAVSGSPDPIDLDGAIAALRAPDRQAPAERAAQELLRKSNPEGLARLRRAVKAIRRRRRGTQ